MVVELEGADVLTVENWNGTGVSAPGSWPCGICRAPHPVHRSWYVEVRSTSGYLRTVACATCAQAAEQQLDD